MPRGGAREGSGRKPKDHIYERAEEEHIELPPWLRRLEIEYVDNTTDPPP